MAIELAERRFRSLLPTPEPQNGGGESTMAAETP
jgi:hypothetical protein